MSVHRVSIDDLKEALKAEPPPLLIDVRTPFEFRSGHVPQARNLDPARVPDDTEEIWVICASGNRSRAAAKALDKKGRRVFDVKGGLAAWQASGGPIAGAKGPNLVFPLLAAATLGLAPFLPEPHLVEKFRFLATAHPLTALDLFDVALHGAPWIWLMVALVRKARMRTPPAQ